MRTSPKITSSLSPHSSNTFLQILLLHSVHAPFSSLGLDIDASRIDSFTDVIVVEPYYPDGVFQILATGGSNYVGLVNENTVLKYPHSPADRAVLEVEAGIYAVLPRHPRILEYKGETKDGTLLGLATNGSLAELLWRQSPQLPMVTRLKLALQASEAVAFIHSHNVLHCDLNASNFLLDENFDLLLCDFQGRVLYMDGSVRMNGGVAENVKSRMPDKEDDEADTKTDIFALGSVIYHIMRGHEPHPQLDPIEDETLIRERFKSQQFPELEPALSGDIIGKCWEGGYTSAVDIVQDLRALSIVQNQ